MRDSTTATKLLHIASVAFFVGIWWVAAVIVGSEIILPTPLETIRSLLVIIPSPNFWPSVVATTTRGLAGFFLSLVLGLMIGILAGLSKTARILIQPLMIVCRSTPVMSIILLALIWFETNQVPVFVGFLIAFPVIFANVTEGIKSVDQKLVDMAHIYKVKKARVVFEVYLPAILPYLIAGISTAMGVGWKVVIAAEVLSQPKYAIGTNMNLEKIFLQTGGVFAWTIVALLLSYISETGIRLLQKKIITW
jgi:NitT/TauT family transport system permease protein